MMTNNVYSLANAVFPVFSVASALTLGTLGGTLFQKLQTRVASLQLHPLLRGCIPLVVSSSVYYISDAMHAEPLLACVAAGAVATYVATTTGTRATSSLSSPTDQIKLHASPSPMQRLQRQGSLSLGGNGGEEEGAITNSQQQQMMTVLLVPVSAALFGLVGANLHVDKILHNAHLAAILFAVRLMGIWIGSWLGGVFGAVPAPLRQRVPFGMITQAGIAMGLTRIVVARCKTCLWGPDFEALMAAIIVINLILGPLLFKSAIVAAGEASGIPSSSSLTAEGGTTMGAGAVPMMTPIKRYQLEEGFVTPVKAERNSQGQHQYDGYTMRSNYISNSTSSFVPIIIHLNPTSPSAKMAL
jgi:hypothetical protein